VRDRRDKDAEKAKDKKAEKRVIKLAARRGRIRPSFSTFSTSARLRREHDVHGVGEVVLVEAGRVWSVCFLWWLVVAFVCFREQKAEKLKEKTRKMKGKKLFSSSSLTSQGPQQRPEPSDVGPGLHGTRRGSSARGRGSHRPGGIRERGSGRGSAGRGATGRERGGGSGGGSGGRRARSGDGVASKRGTVVGQPRRGRRRPLHAFQGLAQGPAQRVDHLELPRDQAVAQGVLLLLTFGAVVVFGSGLLSVVARLLLLLFADGREQLQAVAAAPRRRSAKDALPRVLAFLFVEAGPSAECLAERAGVVGGVGEGLEFWKREKKREEGGRRRYRQTKRQKIEPFEKEGKEKNA